LLLDASQCADRDVALWVRDGDATGLGLMLELHMAALSSHFVPAISPEGGDDLPALHGVYRYTPMHVRQCLLTDLVPLDHFYI